MDLMDYETGARQEQVQPASGSGLGTAILNALGMQSQKQRQEEVNKFFTEIQAAGSRERALEVVKNYSSKFQNTRDITTAFGAVNEFYPESSKEIKGITVYDEDTGEATPRFIPSHQVGILENPEEVKRRYGPKATLTKPDLETFYSQPDEAGRVQILGKLPVSRRPEGAVTLPELTAARTARAEEAREKRDQFSKEKFEAWFGLAETRWATALEKLGETASDRSLQQGRSLLNDFARLTAMSLNGKVLSDGSYSFDDDNRAKLFNERLRFGLEAVQLEPGILKRGQGGLELHARASKAMPLVSETKPPETPAPPKPKKPGLISGLLGGGEKEPAKPAAKSAAEGDPAAQIKSKAAEISARKDITAEQKAAALKRLKEIAAKNKLKVDF